MDSLGYRERLAERLLLLGSIKERKVAQSFERVALEDLIPQTFVPGDIYGTHVALTGADGQEYLESLYSGEAIVTALTDGQPSAWEPSALVTGYLLECASANVGDLVLELSPGPTPYLAALLHELTANKPAAASWADLSDGSHTFYDRIISHQGLSAPPFSIAKLLREDGLAIVPVMHGGWYQLVRVTPDRLARVVGSGGVGLMSAQQQPRQIRAVRPERAAVSVRPLWTHLDLRTNRLLDFSTFVAMSNDDACIVAEVLETGKVAYKGPGMATGQNWAMMPSGMDTVRGTPDGIRSVEASFHEWQQLGSPAISSYTLSETRPKDPSTPHWFHRCGPTTWWVALEMAPQ